MSEGKVKASKVKVYAPPEGTGGLDGKYHVYVFDIFNRAFLPGSESFDTIERAAAHQRSTQERIYTEQEADPELFDLPFISTDPDLTARVEREPEYRDRLQRELASDGRQRARRR